MDEGFKKLVYSLIDPLTRMADLLVLTTCPAGAVPPPVRAARANRLLLGLELGRAVRRFRPDVVIYVPQAAATLNSFIRCGVLRGYAPGARLLMVALQPRSYGRAARHLIPRLRLLRPDLILVQSLDTQDGLRAFGCQTAMLPSGIDLAAFQPAAAAAKRALRAKYGLGPDAFVVLHVGHQSRTRNVLLLNRMRAELGCDTVLVASTSTHVDGDVGAAIRQGGTLLIDRYVEHVAELYQMADCYLFPVHVSTSSVNMPLSVLEAMACGLPVVTTPFGSLPLWFSEGPGFVFADTDDGLVAAVAHLYQARERVSPEQMRARVAPFSWAALAETLLSFARSATPESVHHPVDQKSIHRA